jgi:hypothetical protein
MALDKSHVIDAAGVEKDTGCVVLTIADHWSWDDQKNHLLALQEKLNAYFNFIESGEILEAYPDAAGRPIVIDVIGRFPIPEIGIDFLERASAVAADLGVTIRNHHYPDE